MEIQQITADNFNDLYHAYARKVTGYLFKHGIPESDIDDVAQNAWLTAWRYRDKFDPKKGNLNTFIFLQCQAAVSWHFRKARTQLHFLGYSLPIAEDYRFDEDGRPIQAHVTTDADAGWMWTTSGKVPRHEEETEQERSKHKTHCKHGHEMTPENVSITPSGDRRCIACRRGDNRKPRKKKGICRRGHDLTNPENTFTQGADRYVRCRLCKNQNEREREAKKCKSPAPRTHCQRGHAQIPGNVITTKFHRYCGPCDLERREKYKARNRELTKAHQASRAAGRCFESRPDAVKDLSEQT
jgi:DNA-directed RNA polymerase specialized sigma24 family protein